jgi:hypothetical protein
MNKYRKLLNPVWAMLTKPNHRPFFDTLAVKILEKNPETEIIVADRKHHFMMCGPNLVVVQFNCRVFYL